jgi:hypothetical protein
MLPPRPFVSCGSRGGAFDPGDEPDQIGLEAREGVEVGRRGLGLRGRLLHGGQYTQSFPWCGKKFSMVWKTFRKIFHGMENGGGCGGWVGGRTSAGAGPDSPTGQARGGLGCAGRGLPAWGLWCEGPGNRQAADFAGCERELRAMEFSMAWKTCAGFFHGMENCSAKGGRGEYSIINVHGAEQPPGRRAGLQRGRAAEGGNHERGGNGDWVARGGEEGRNGRQPSSA